MNKIKVDGQILVVPNGYSFMGFDDEGIPEFNSSVFPTSRTRLIDYNSDNVSELPHGGVTKQVRENFKYVGAEGIVKANHARSIYSAFSKEGYRVTLQKVPGKKTEFLAKRMPKA